VVEVEVTSDEEDEDNRRDSEHGKLMSYTYDQEEQQQDVQIYKVEWDMAHHEAFGDIDMDALNNNVAQVDLDKIMMEKEDLDDMLKEQETQFVEKQRQMEQEYLQQMEQMQSKMKEMEEKNSSQQIEMQKEQIRITAELKEREKRIEEDKIERKMQTDKQ